MFAIVRNSLKGLRTERPPKSRSRAASASTEQIEPASKEAHPHFGLPWLGIFAAVVLAFLAALLATTTLSPKIGYVDTTLLLQRYEKAEEARATFQGEAAAWQQNVQTLQRELAELTEGLTNGSLQGAALTERQQQIEEKEGELARYSRALAERAAQREQELMEPVFAEINAQMRAFGDHEGYDLVFGTVAGGNILYAADATDLTEDVLAFLHSR